jgi:hypothetical protein
MGEKMGKAYVYELMDAASIANVALKDVQGKFFIEPIRTSTQTGVLPETDLYKFELIQFFTRTKAKAVTMLICHLKTDQANGQADLEDHLRAINNLGPFEFRYKVFGASGSLQASLEAASLFIRGSRTLAESDFKNAATWQVAADANGVAVVGRGYGSNFEKDCRSVALCFAYKSILNGLIVDLSKVGLAKGANAETKLKEWAYFMSAYYFVLPISQHTNALCEIYSAVNSRQKLAILAAEATEQLQLLAKLVRLERTEEQSARDKKFQIGLTLLGLFIGMLQIFQLTPEIVGKSWHAWLIWLGVN